MTSGSGKEKNIDGQINCLIQKSLESSKDRDDSSYGVFRNITTREEELTNNKATKAYCQVRICLKTVFGFAEHTKKRNIWIRIKDNATMKCC